MTGMTSERLIEEGRRLQRPCTFLRPDPGNLTDDIAGMWHSFDDSEPDEQGMRCWLTINTRFVPFNTEWQGFLTLFTDEENHHGGKIEVTQEMPDRAGLKLFAHSAEILPPVEAVFLHGSSEVASWLAENEWERDSPYFDDFPDNDAVEPYRDLWMNEFPLYRSDVFAALGGWHMSWPDDDWYSQIKDQLVIFTIQNSEPWVELWRYPDGTHEVVQRIT